MINLHDDEKIFKVARRHWYVFLTEIVGVFLISLIPFLLLILGAIFFPGIFTIEIIGLFFLVTALLWGVLAIVFFVIWTNYYLDAWIITNKRIIDIEQHGLFMREVSEYSLDKVQDVTVKAFGILASTFKFGDVDVQTAGERSSHFIIKNCTNPDEVKGLVFSLAQQRKGTSGSAADTSQTSGNPLV